MKGCFLYININVLFYMLNLYKVPYILYIIPHLYSLVLSKNTKSAMGIVELSYWRLNIVVVLLVCVLALSSTKGSGQPLVPALFIFGDSVVDVGNNNHLETLVKSNFPPYGRDFINHHPTGRFCNGKLASDFTGKYSFMHQVPKLLKTNNKTR